MATTANSSIIGLSDQIKKWVLIFLAIFVVSCLIKLGFTAQPFMVIFLSVAFLFIIPYIWQIYGKEATVLEFWTALVKNGLKISASVLIYMLIRGHVEYFVDFGMVTAHEIAQNSSKLGFLEHNPREVLFETTFLLLAGYTVLLAVYKKDVKWARTLVVGTLIVCVLVQGLMFSTGDSVVAKAIEPVREGRLLPAVESSGVVGGTVKRTWAFLFGEPKPETKVIKHQDDATTLDIYYKPYNVGTYKFVLGAREQTEGIEIGGDKKKYVIKSDSDNFVIMYDDGTVAGGGKETIMPDLNKRTRMRIISQTDNDIIVRMVVTNN